MQSVDLCDVVTVEALDHDGDSKIGLTCSEPAVPTGEKNIAYKAAVAFFQKSGIDSYNCRIHIDKHIPMEAGLAGGSTDAAAVLRLLNKAYSTGFDTDTLCTIGGTLGADVPFCIRGGTYLCEGIGEILSPLPSIPDCHIVVARGGAGISTPIVYGLVDERFNRDFSKSGGDFEEIHIALKHGDIRGIAKSMYNIFEDVVLPVHSVASELKRIMLKHDAVGAMMSGSGPSVFGIFESEESANNAVRDASKIARAFMCRPVGEITK